ncbi:MAG: glycosyltransferase family 2 protein [Elusimicrobiota bacterium]
MSRPDPITTMKSISISIPAYNEEGAIARVVGDSFKVLSALTDDYEVVVIDDGSTDSTAKILRELSAHHPGLRIYRHDKNMGIGPTLKDVVSYPTKEWVFFIPGDGQIPAAEIHKLLPWTANYDYIIGRRIARKDNAVRRMNAWIYNMVISFMGLKRVFDVDSVVLFRREILKNIRFKSRGAFIHAEIFLSVLKGGGKTVEVSIEHLPRTGGGATGNKIAVVLKAAADIILYLLS